MDGVVRDYNNSSALVLLQVIKTGIHATVIGKSSFRVAESYGRYNSNTLWL